MRGCHGERLGVGHGFGAVSLRITLKITDWMRLHGEEEKRADRPWR